MALLMPSAIQAVEGAIARAESKSAGELVVAVLRRSDAYTGPRALVAAGVTFLVATGLAWALPGFWAEWVVLAQVPVAAAAWAVCGVPPVLRALAGRQRRQQAAHARALQLFAERGVHHTRDHSGLLIFISELEHQVVLLGDRGIHAHIGADGWERHVQVLVSGIRRGHLDQALVQVIDAFGAVLAAKFPRRPDDVNELPDEVVLQ